MEGCQLLTTIANFPSNTDYEIPWSSQIQFGSESFWSSGSRIVIPAALNGQYVEFFGAHATSDAGSVGMDGNTVIGHAGVRVLTGLQHDNFRWSPFAQRTGLYQVSTGDEFFIRYRTFGTTGNENLPRIKFGCIVNPHEHLLGLVRARLVSDVAAGSILSWDTPLIDTANTHDGATLFIAPTGAKAAVVALSSNTSGTGSNSFTTYAIDKNLSQYAITNYDSQFRAGYGGSWLIDVSPGDSIRAFISRAGTLTATQTNLHIEWYG